MGRRHLRGMARLHGSPLCNMELVAVCDLNADNANFYADEAKELLGTRPRVFSDIAQMKREMPEIQAVDVTTDAGAHLPVVLACLEAGLHVQCEKPLSVSVRACNVMIDAARRRNLVLSTAENFRRDPINRLGKALLNDGAIGEPRLMIETTIGGRDNLFITPWRHMKHTGTVVVDEGVHHADILRYYMGEFRSVYGETRLHEKTRRSTKTGGPGGFYARWQAAMPDTIQPTGDDALYCHISFQNGTVGQWINDHSGHGLRQQGRHIHGSKGSLQLPGDRNGRPIKLHFDDGTVIDDERILEYAPSYKLEPLAAEFFGGERVWTYSFEFNDTDSRILGLELYELGQAALGQRQVEVTGEEGRAALALTYAPFESGRLGRAVTLDDMITGRADVYQREIDEKIGLLQPARA
jgi:predicted dehydrogenase